MRQKKSVDRYVFEQKLWLQIWFCCLQISQNDAPSLYCVFWNLCDDDDKCNEYHFLLRYRQAGATTVFQIYILGDQRVERWRKLLVSPWSIVIPGYRLHAYLDIRNFPNSRASKWCKKSNVTLLRVCHTYSGVQSKQTLEIRVKQTIKRSKWLGMNSGQIAWSRAATNNRWDKSEGPKTGATVFLLRWTLAFLSSLLSATMTDQH